MRNLNAVSIPFLAAITTDKIAVGAKLARIVAVILLLNLSVIAGSLENDGRWFRLGSRMGLTGIDVVTDAEREVYASNYGQGGALTIDAAIEVASNFYLHVAAGLDYRWFDDFGVLKIECDGDCGGYWNGYNETSFLYLELPLLTQWRTSALFLEIGPVIDLLLVKDEDYFAPSKYRAERCYEDNRFGAGISAGVGHIFSFGLFVDVRVTYQLTDVVEDRKGCLTLKSVEYEMQMDANGDTTDVKIVSESSEYVGGSYYKLMKYQIGVGYWF